MKNLNSTNFNNFYVANYKRSYLFTKSYVHNDLVAEDIASEILIKLWEKSEVEEIENPLKLLYVMLKNKSLDYLKHEKIKQEALTSVSADAKRELDIRISTLEAMNPEKIFADDIQNIIQKTLSELPEQTRKIFEMSRFKNMPKKEIADIFDITVKGIDYHISKALSSLRETLKDYFPAIGFMLINYFNNTGY